MASSSHGEKRGRFHWFLSRKEEDEEEKEEEEEPMIISFARAITGCSEYSFSLKKNNDEALFFSLIFSISFSPSEPCFLSLRNGKSGTAIDEMRWL